MLIYENIPLAPLTTWKIGGPARFFCEPTREELPQALDFARSHALELFVLGRGSNVLIADQGIDGLVLSTRKLDALRAVEEEVEVEVEEKGRPDGREAGGRPPSSVRQEEGLERSYPSSFLVPEGHLPRSSRAPARSAPSSSTSTSSENTSGIFIRAEAGVSLPRLCKFAAAQGWGGYEWLIGIPGSVGGAIVMNAGFKKGDPREMRAIVHDFELLLPDASLQTLTMDAIHAGYRYTDLMRAPAAHASEEEEVEEEEADARAEQSRSLSLSARTGTSTSTSSGSAPARPDGREEGGKPPAEVRNEERSDGLNLSPSSSRSRDLPLSSRAPARPRPIVLSARFRCIGMADPDAIRELTREHLSTRKRTQPLTRPTAGSVFAAVEDGTPAAVFIDQAGLKGYVIGGAMVSPKHANWIENTGNATAADVLALIAHIQDVVKNKYGHHLRVEVRFLGLR